MSLYNKNKKWFNGDEEVKVIPRPGDTFNIDNKPFKWGVSEPDRVYVNIILMDRWYKIFVF